ncbi:MAG TPA: hypothetical protein VD699_00900 [Nitrosopumilaceae archaeon]|nr:hypothetical protein [Nitrosopumilaceae archaeon]
MNPKQGGCLRFVHSVFNLRVIIPIVSLVMISFYYIPAFAQQNEETRTDSEFTIVTGEELKKNPMAMKILENIEIAKKRFAEMQDAQKKKTANEKFIEEQRKIAKAQLEKDLARMNKEYEDFTPRNAFSKFVSNVNATHHAIFWDQFDYMDERIKIATQAKKAILENGGSYAEARAEFIKYASMSRESMIQFVSELNIKYGFTDEHLQSYFDKDGKLPRYENDEFAVCYACEKYEKIKEKILADSKSA